MLRTFGISTCCCMNEPTARHAHGRRFSSDGQSPPCGFKSATLKPHTIQAFVLCFYPVTMIPQTLKIIKVGAIINAGMSVLYDSNPLGYATQTRPSEYYPTRLQTARTRSAKRQGQKRKDLKRKKSEASIFLQPYRLLKEKILGA